MNRRQRAYEFVGRDRLIDHPSDTETTGRLQGSRSDFGLPRLWTGGPMRRPFREFWDDLLVVHRSPSDGETRSGPSDDGWLRFRSRADGVFVPHKVNGGVFVARRSALGRRASPPSRPSIRPASPRETGVGGLLKRHSAREESVRWDSREHADAAAGVIGPRLQQHLSGNAQGAPDIRLFEVLAG